MYDLRFLQQSCGGSRSAVMWCPVTELGFPDAWKNIVSSTWRVDGMWHFVTGLLLPNVHMNIMPSYSSIQFFFNTSVLEDKAKKIIWDIKKHQPINTVSHPRRPESLNVVLRHSLQPLFLFMWTNSFVYLLSSTNKRFVVWNVFPLYSQAASSASHKIPSCGK
jgi:hypothetical protein